MQIKQRILFNAGKRMVSILYRDMKGNFKKVNGQISILTDRLCIVRNIRTKHYTMVLLDGIHEVRSKKQKLEFPSIIPVTYTKEENGFKALSMPVLPSVPVFQHSFM